MKMIIAPTYRQAMLFCVKEGWNPSAVRVITRPEQLQGFRLELYEVWWLDRMWPCRTHEDVDYMQNMKKLAKSRGADLHRWWT